MASNGAKEAILNGFIEKCQPARTPLLGFLEPDEEVRVCASDTDEIVNSLAEEFSPADLIESGLLAVQGDGTLTLVSALSGGTPFIVLRDAGTGQPYDLLTDTGCLAADALPIFQILRDAHTQQLLQEGPGLLVLAFSVAQVALLRSCGLASTLATGLDDFPLEHLDRLCETFGLSSLRSGLRMFPEERDAILGISTNPDVVDPLLPAMEAIGRDDENSESQTAPGTDAPSDNVPLETAQAYLVVLSWSPLQLSSAPPGALQAALDHLNELQRHLELDLEDIILWEVDEDFLERLQFIAERRSAALFRDVVRDAVEDSETRVADFGKEKPPVIGPPKEYASALARLQGASAAGRSGALTPIEKGYARKRVLQLLHEQVLGPLHEFALAAEDPVERNILVAFAELSTLFHLNSISLGEQLSRYTVQSMLEQGIQLPQDQYKNILAMAGRLIAMANVRQQCNPPKATIIEVTANDSPGFPRSPHSG
mgnify:CR=1 FL=1